MFSAFEQLKIQSKLMVIFGAIVFIGALITGWTVLAINKLDTLTIELEDTEFELSDSVQTKNLIRELELAELSYVITGDEVFLHEHEHFQSGVELYLRNSLVRTENPQAQAILFELEREYESYQISLEEVAEAVENGEHERAEELGLESGSKLEGMLIEINQIIERLQPQLDEKVAESTQQVRTSAIVGVVALLTFLVLAIGAALVTNRQVVDPIVRLQQAAQQINEGAFDPASLADLAERQDEMGQLARSFIRMSHDVSTRENILTNKISEIKGKLAQI